MPHRTVCKAFLLDELDAQEELASPIESFEQLGEIMPELLIEEIGWPDYPVQNVIALASERFDTGRVTSGFGGAEFVRHDTSWKGTIAHIGCDVGRIGDAVMTRFLENEDVAFLSSHLKDLMQEHIAQDTYSGAQEHLLALETLLDAGLPCFEPLYQYSRGGGSSLFDARTKDYGSGTGTRVLVEILQTW